MHLPCPALEPRDPRSCGCRNHGWAAWSRDKGTLALRNPDAKIDGRKVFYRSNTAAKNGRELRFESDVPLWPGANYVTVHARENEEVQAQDTLVIFRKPASLAGAKSSRR